jgi:UDP-2,3-diacylglucosamine pyrophosphatase LpxH
MRGEYVHLASRIEETFPRFIDHYIREGSWQLVVNGDFIDFWNVELTDADAADPEALAIRRVEAVLDAHPRVEDALVRFLRAGNGVVLVAGNHDAELAYPGVRAAVARRIEGAVHEQIAPIARTGTVRLDELDAGRLRFVRWFLREEGGAWIEHGHTFDPACATTAQLAPMRRGRLVQTVAEVATRGFTNLMPEMAYDAYKRFSALDYVRWAFARGARFLIRVLLLYLRMAGRALALWAGPGRVDAHGRQEHEERLARVAANAGLQMSALTALERMAPPPAATSVWGVLSVTALDRAVAVVVPMFLGIAIAAGLGSAWWQGAGLGALVSAAWLAWLFRSNRSSGSATDMAALATRVANLTGVPLVLMGHSHHGTLCRQGGVVYANSGSWLDGSHLVVSRNPDTGKLVHAELRRWRNGGITRLADMTVDHGPGPEAVPSGEDAPGRELPVLGSRQ